MIAFVTGGSGSGKSAWAETLTHHLCPGPKFYLATMRPFGAEADVRIARHRNLRAGKGFTTLERPDGLVDLPDPGGVFLLECLSNRLANAMFSPGAPENCVPSLWRELSTLLSSSAHLVVVSNEVFSDGISYDPDTLRYLDQLGQLNRLLAAQADLVAEVVCGLPLFYKGALPC